MTPSRELLLRGCGGITLLSSRAHVLRFSRYAVARTSAEALMDLVGEILAKEPLVSRLVAAQALDVLEIEGGGLVFEKLVSLCGGSK